MCAWHVRVAWRRVRMWGWTLTWSPFRSTTESRAYRSGIACMSWHVLPSCACISGGVRLSFMSFGGAPLGVPPASVTSDSMRTPDVEEFSWDGLLIENDDDEAMYFSKYYIPLYIRHPPSFVTFEKSHLRGLPVTWYCAHHLIYDI
jgi:hypothetical protein